MWSRRSIDVLIAVSLLAAMTACTVTPRRPAQPARAAAANAHPGAGKPAAAGPPPVPAQAQQGFAQALALARAGNDAAAEAQLASLARQYPQFHTPLVDLGILYRQSGNLEAATRAFRQAVARDPHSARAWTELGVAQRLGGKFADAERSYAQAIAANPAYAAAYRDRGVLRDLYLNEPAAALGDFEKYRKLAAGDKPVAMWIAELQHRTGAVPVAVLGGRAPGPPSPGRSLAGARTHQVSSLNTPARPQARN
jgi:tetratricopeptide (TPR) repeat protein